MQHIMWKTLPTVMHKQEAVHDADVPPTQPATHDLLRTIYLCKIHQFADKSAYSPKHSIAVYTRPHRTINYMQLLHSQLNGPPSDNGAGFQAVCLSEGQKCKVKMSLMLFHKNVFYSLLL